MIKKRFGEIASYEEWLEPYLVSNTLEILDKEIPRLKSKITSVHLCFTTDPFMYGYDEIEKMSLAAIKKLNNAGIKCTVLTKACKYAEHVKALNVFVKIRRWQRFGNLEEIKVWGDGACRLPEK